MSFCNIHKDKQINGSYFHVAYSLDEELNSLLGVPKEESTTDIQNVETDIAAGISSIHLASTTAVSCSNCRQPTPTCKHDKRIDTPPHVGLKFHYGAELKVLSVKHPRSLISSNE